MNLKEMKKKIVFFSVLLFLMLSAPFAQQKKDWKEMKSFHSIMSKTFHPTEDGNMQPLKDSVDILVATAKTWQSAQVPEGYNAKVTKPILKKLVKQCNTIKKAVMTKKSDDELKKLIAAAHDIFHEIMEKCTKEEHQ